MHKVGHLLKLPYLSAKGLKFYFDVIKTWTTMTLRKVLLSFTFFQIHYSLITLMYWQYHLVNKTFRTYTLPGSMWKFVLLNGLFTWDCVCCCFVISIKNTFFFDFHETLSEHCANGNHDIYSVIRKSLWDFRPLRYSSREGHAEGEHVNRGRDTPNFCPNLQVLQMSKLGDAADVNPVIKFLPHTCNVYLILYTE